MSEPVRCASCGLPLDRPGPGGLCPICLLKMGLDAAESPDTAGAETAGTAVTKRVGAAAAAMPGSIGPYRLVRMLGEGGMGVVYLAEQAEPIRRTVALKLIKLGMDTRDVVARFNAERQTLALMDHPNIASVLDAGAAPDGRPYFVMEHAPGVPITDFCDANRLSTRQRLVLFIDVCAAIQHAHQKGIIHRDLKPSNVLVIEQDGHAVPKVIDFGIAKATDQRLTERAMFTQQGLLVGTPEYMSPEQATFGAVDLDTRTDVYSLGVMLYELLVGSLPFSPTRLRDAGYSELVRIIREEEPMRPSTRLTTAGGTANTVAARRQTKVPTLTHELRGDLDWITLKALEKDRRRRYATVSEFAADLTRYLADEPVVARPPSVAYRVQKFVRRNRLAVTAASIVALAVIAGLVTSSVLYVRAERARTDADRQRAVAEQQRGVADRQTLQAQTARREADQQRTVADDRRVQAELAQGEAERQRGQAEQESYRATIAAADLLLQSNQVVEARSRLAAAPAALRNWEWKYLYAQSDSSLSRIGTGGGAPTSIAFTPDGSKIVWVSDRGFLRAAIRADYLPIAGSHRPARSTGQPESVIAVSPDGSKYVTTAWMTPVFATLYFRVPGMREGQEPTKEDMQAVQNARGFAAARPVRGWPTGKGPLWDPPMPSEELRTLSVKNASSDATLARLPLASIGVSVPVRATIRTLDSRLPGGDNRHDAGFTIGRSRDGVAFYDTSRQVVATLSGPPWSVVSAVFSADGGTLAAWSWDNVVTVWDIASGRLLATLSGHEDGITHVAFNQAGSQIASASHDGTIRVWDLPSGANSRILKGHEGAVMSVAFSADGIRIASGGVDRSVRVWDAAGSSTVMLRGHTDTVTAVTFSPKGRLLVSGSRDKAIRVWDLASMRPVGESKGHLADITTLAFSPDGRHLASGSADDSVRIWDMRGVRVLPADPAVVSDQTGYVHDLHASLGRVVTSTEAGGAFQWWDLDTPERFRTLGYTSAGAGPRATTPSASKIISLALTPDGLKAVAGSGDGTVRLWTLDGTVPPLVLSSPKSPAMMVAIRPDGAGVAAVFLDRSLRIWDSARGWAPAVVGSAPDEVRRLSFTPDGRRVAAAAGRAVTLWDVRTRAVVLQTAPLRQTVSSMAVSADGRRIAAGDTNGNMRIWDVGSGEVVTSVDEDGSGGGDCMAFDPTGTRLFVSSHHNRRVQIWDVTTSHALLQLHLQDRPADRLAVGGGGAWLSVLSGDSSVGVFDTRSSYPLNADQLVYRLFAQTPRSSEVIDRLRRDPSLDRAVRRTAEQMARAQGSNGERLIAESTLIAEFQGRSPEEYRRALTYAQAAVDELPASVGAADALGLALYRLGHLRESVAAFQHGRSLRGGLEFVEAVFTAMALARLDDEGAEAFGDHLTAYFVIKVASDLACAVTWKSTSSTPRSTSARTAAAPPGMSRSRKQASASTGSQVEIGGSSSLNRAFAHR